MEKVIFWNIVLLGLLVCLSALRWPPRYLDRLHICMEPKESGHCYENQLRWYYDSTSKLCRTFYYRGCGGNHNRFLRQGGCRNYCMNPDYPGIE